jgi:ADP-ribose pyrophosphatase
MNTWKRVEPTIKMKIDYHEVVIKTFQLPNNNLATRATFFSETARAAGVIAITTDNKVIVGHQFRPGPEKMMIEIPGGGVGTSEDPEKAAVRELLEETGYTAGKTSFLGAFHRDAYVNGTWYYYLAMDCRPTHSQTLDHDEFIDLELMSITDFLASAKRGDMTDPFAVLAAYDKLKELQKKEKKR